MKTFIIAFILALGFTVTSNAQLSKLTNSNPYKGTGSTWFSKINLSIDSINAHTNQMLDKLSISDTGRTNSVLQKSFARNGGAGGINTDSIALGIIRVDSIKSWSWIQSDTGRWSYRGFVQPTGNYVSTGYRYGTVKMKAQIRCEYGRHASFSIVVDSANNVKGVNSRFITSAVTANGYTPLGQAVQHSAWQMPIGGMAYSGGGWGGESKIEYVDPNGTYQTEYWIYSNNGYWVTIDIEIDYAIPNTGSSTWIAKIISL